MKAKIALLNWIIRGGINVVDVPTTAYGEIAEYIEKYTGRDIDFTDAALIWLANEYQQPQILTVDKTDFSVFRLKENRWFDLLEWY
jgi:predicted nucleic acid-binding protein